jgi:hypothetical protein
MATSHNVTRLLSIEPSCPHGYTSEDIYKILGDDQDDLWYFMRGQTMTLCDGTEYDHARKGYFTTACSNMLPGMPLTREEIGYLAMGHGGVVYKWDLERFLRGLPIID